MRGTQVVGWRSKLARAPCKARQQALGNPQCPADAKRLADGLLTDIDSVTLTALVAASCKKGAHRLWIFLQEYLTSGIRKDYLQ